MGSYRVRLKNSAEKDLRKLPADVLRRVLVIVSGLASDPISHSSIKLTNADRLYRLRVGDYRVVYEVQGEEVTVVAIRHRREVYRSL
jgi:mRNA interferase RelE/StbE